MIDVLINGINGRMGRAVYALASESKEISVVCGVDKKTIGNFNCPVYSDLSEFDGHADAVIDFSSPSSLDNLLSFCTQNGTALLLATTGYSREQLSSIKAASQSIPICLTANVSAGISAIRQCIPVLARALPDANTVICETHRKNKKDTPSGTALMLKGELDAHYKGVEVHSIRGGDIPGEHEITFLLNGERITLKHTVFSREVFASGAIDLCKKLIRLPAGLYGNEIT